MVGLIKTIFFLVIFYYLFKFIGRVFLPIFINNRVKKMHEQQFGQTQQNYRQQQEEGKVTIQKKVKTNKAATSDIGEYTDFEEVK
ncbi:DUF4834 family protein [Labilibacter sediminis]|nr:DUF4834 family protein [Labilibacter sediminis]